MSGPGPGTGLPGSDIGLCQFSLCDLEEVS